MNEGGGFLFWMLVELDLETHVSDGPVASCTIAGCCVVGGWEMYACWRAWGDVCDNCSLEW
jgi:hypothetical protein